MFINHIDFAELRKILADSTDRFAAQGLALLDKATSAAATPAQIQAAADIHACDEVEFDDQGVCVAMADDGYWVQAWVWVPEPEDQDWMHLDTTDHVR